MQISTLIKDIYDIIGRKDGWFSDELASEFGVDISKRLQQQLGISKGPPRLRLSQMGPRCPHALWHAIRKPEQAEALPPWAEIKYTYGHILEALVIALTKAAGHSVEGEQDAVELDGVVGHRDCIIDGCLVDVKSASSRAFSKFRDKSIKESDTFGYLEQLDGYLVGSHSDPLLKVKDKGYLLAIDKTLGHMVLYEHRLREDAIRQRVKYYKQIVGQDTPPACECRTVPEGKSGNYKLDVRAGYDDQKYSCFPHLRTFLYAAGPMYLTKVVRRPSLDIVEVNKHGQIVYS